MKKLYVLIFTLILGGCSLWKGEISNEKTITEDISGKNVDIHSGILWTGSVSEITGDITKLSGDIESYSGTCPMDVYELSGYHIDSSKLKNIFNLGDKEIALYTGEIGACGKALYIVYSDKNTKHRVLDLIDAPLTYEVTTGGVNFEYCDDMTGSEILPKGGLQYKHCSTVSGIGISFKSDHLILDHRFYEGYSNKVYNLSNGLSPIKISFDMNGDVLVSDNGKYVLSYGCDGMGGNFGIALDGVLGKNINHDFTQDKQFKGWDVLDFCVMSDDVRLDKDILYFVFKNEGSGDIKGKYKVDLSKYPQLSIEKNTK